MARLVGALLLVVVVAGCGVGTTAPFLPTPPCREQTPRAALPLEVRESSGVVPARPPGSSGGLAGSYWTHNDSGWPPELFRVGGDGRVLDRVRVQGAQNVDWEDLTAGACPDVPGARCLFIADTGDNAERRQEVALYRVREPLPGDTVTAPAVRIPIRLPHGPRDIEAAALLPEGSLLLVTKGRNHPVEVYHLAGPLAPGPGPLVPERVQTLSAGPAGLGELAIGGVTGGTASATAEGEVIVALRNYEELRFYRLVILEGGGLSTPRLLPLDGGRINLRPLREPQGEAVAFAGEGRIVLTSEGGPGSGPGAIQLLDCRVGFERWGVTPVP
jgi:hypothetical protein